MQTVSKLSLYHFRNYDYLDLEIPPSESIFLSGPNGVGKTNILEALSLFSPGRGLRRAKFSDMANNKINEENWASSITVSGDIAIPLELKCQYQDNKRTININQTPVKTHTEIADHIRVVWVTPDMGRLFIDSSSNRRRFIDRFIYSFDPSYLSIVNQYEHYLKERSILLKKGIRDDRWLTHIEENMAQLAIMITQKRTWFVDLLSQQQCQETTLPPFEIAVTGDVETHYNSEPLMKEWLLEEWKKRRNSDALSGGSHLGPHRSDLNIIHKTKNMPAYLCSTGEQKILLFALVISFIRAFGTFLEKRDDPILMLILFDDIIAHFDLHHRMVLFNEVRQFNALNYLNVSLQTWMTSAQTDNIMWEGLYHIDLTRCASR